MLAFILWYLLVSLVGWATFPLAFRLLPGLADCGYAFSRSLGWLLWGYIFWLLASLGIARNDSGGLLLSLGLLLALSLWAGRGLRWSELRGWWRAQRKLVFTIEGLFLVAFAGWALVRAANPDAFGTEKPMELAFINAILHSPTFPPHDPWLSGYAISYYYFGYVMVAMLAKLTGVAGGVAFNLGIALVFALSATGAFGLVYSLLNARFRGGTRTALSATRALTLSLFGPLFILIVSNLEGFLDVLHQRGLFWRTDAAGNLTSPFWSWLDILDLNQPPSQPLHWIPERVWWWWRASRVVRDYNFALKPQEVIDEFPFFSYLLADLHPHVLAMPFAMLAMALALGLFLDGTPGRMDWLYHRASRRALTWGSLAAAVLGVALLALGGASGSLRSLALGLFLFILGAVGLLRYLLEPRQTDDTSVNRPQGDKLYLGMPFYIRPANFFLAAVALGGMAFLNIWDFPIYVALFAGAYALKMWLAPVTATSAQGVEVFSESQVVQPQPHSLGSLAKNFFGMALALGVVGVVLYLPFYLGFSSQAGGFLPNLIYPTRGAQLWVMFGTLFLPVFAFLIYLLRRRQAASYLKWGFSLAIGLALALWLLSMAMAFGILSLPQVNSLFLGSLEASARGALFSQALLRRVVNLGGWVTLIGLLGLVIALLIQAMDRRWEARAVDESGPEYASALTGPLSPGNAFTLLLILLATLVVLAPEFFFLRDQFGNRMNTIFKFYYQAWLMWGIAAAYSISFLLMELRRPWSLVFQLGLVLVLAVGLVYPLLGVWDKTNGFKPQEWTLDGTAYLVRQSPEEMSAIRWLQQAPPGVLAEAVGPGGGQYSAYARVSMLSGQPAVLGWVGHEGQWRGGYDEVGSRQADLERLYCTRDWNEALPILEQYQIRYVFVGPLDRAAYPPNEGTCPAGLNQTKFDRNLKIAFQAGDVTVYEVPEAESILGQVTQP